MRVAPCLLAALCAAAPVAAAHAQKLESLWYSVDREESTASFLAHAGDISIVSPQVFSIDSAGVIWGSVDPRIVAAAHAKGVKVVPLVMNPGFDQPTIHKILTNADSRQRALANLAALCRNNHFDGIQYDIENVNIVDRDLLTSFMRESVGGLHAAGCTVSAAVVPRTSDEPGPTSFHRWIFENWRGVYDYKALADALDFISFMTYAQHTGGTPPGPVAGYTWIEQSLKFVLSLGVPPAKISLGIPAYSDWWYPTFEPTAGSRMRGSDISYSTASGLLARNSARSTWDPVEKNYYSFWPNDGTNEFLWIEDARAFSAKLELVRQYHLRGYSVWVLGLEDPAVWALPSLRQ
jgi:spore germination protein YaaH